MIASCLWGAAVLQRDDDAGSSKKPRVVWSVEMHQQFVQAVNQLGIDSEWAGQQAQQQDDKHDMKAVPHCLNSCSGCWRLWPGRPAAVPAA